MLSHTWMAQQAPPCNDAFTVHIMPTHGKLADTRCTQKQHTSMLQVQDPFTLLAQLVTPSPCMPELANMCMCAYMYTSNG